MSLFTQTPEGKTKDKKETLPTKMIDIEEYARSQGVELPESNFDDSKGEMTPEIPKITVLHQAQQFKMPDETKKDEIAGVIIGYSLSKAYWEGDRENLTETTPPTCFSFDGVKPDTAEPKSNECHSCTLNLPGSDKKSLSKMGRLCKTKPRIVIYVPSDTFPMLLSLSPTAIKPLRGYISSLDSKKKKLQAVITQINLQEVRKGSYVYSTPVFKMIELPEYLENNMPKVNSTLENAIRLRKSYDEYSKVQITADEEGVGADGASDGEPF